MIRPAVELQKTHEAFYFIADYHALTSVRDAKQLREGIVQMAASFLAFGFDPSKGALFLQSHIPEIPELSWILSCLASFGDLTRAHAFKAAKDEGKEGELNLGVFSYPVLMAADILAYNSDDVPVGQDQTQHIEMTRQLAQRFNHYYGEVFKIPNGLIQASTGVIPGVDGERKMSKSYGNFIEPLAPEKVLKAQVMSIVTDSLGLEDKKDPTNSAIIKFYKFFASPNEVKEMEEKYRAGGYGYGHAKLALLDKIHDFFGPARKRYEELMKNPVEVHSILKDGMEKARAEAALVLDRCRKACGLS
jgi:tryptophanyl-tRNA synthetase